VIASTQADLFCAVTGAYCALTGPLHGGAPEPVLEMLDAIGTREKIKPWIDGALARKERLMGFGHRVYRVRDPRADVLKAVVRQLGSEDETGHRLAFAEKVEQMALEVLRIAKPSRSIQTNVEFFTALLLEATGFPEEAFTSVFAAGRVAGWIAHAREQQTTGRLIRPQSLYIGPVPDLVA
jgi:citrate synthase